MEIVERFYESYSGSSQSADDSKNAHKSTYCVREMTSYSVLKKFLCKIIGVLPEFLFNLGAEDGEILSRVLSVLGKIEKSKDLAVALPAESGADQVLAEAARTYKILLELTVPILHCGVVTKFVKYEDFVPKK